jgi:hypothetical protein
MAAKLPFSFTRISLTFGVHFRSPFACG